MLQAVIAEGKRRDYIDPEIIAILAVALHENWPPTTDVAGFFDLYETVRGYSPDPMASLFRLRHNIHTTDDPQRWLTWKASIYAHVQRSAALLEGTGMSYGLPTGTRINYGGAGFPDWVYQLANVFGLKASTYPGHQESNRNEAGFAPNPSGLNRGIDWSGPVDGMQRFADYLATIPMSVEQLIWENPQTGSRTGIAGGRDVTQTGYYANNYAGHRDHVHTRQSAPIPLPSEEAPVGWTGDPIWLADVLRAEGVTVVEREVGGIRWNQRGHGDMGSLWGVVNHHTGSNGSTWQSIWHGRSDLPGPLSQIHLRRDGVAELVAVGVCYHAGTGNYGDLGRHQGNKRTIGIECQNDGTSGWPRAQYDALVKCNAAFNRRIGVDASHSIAHWEYDDGDPATDEGKWDPGGLWMPKFREDIQARLTSTGGFLMALSDAEQREVLDLARQQAAVRRPSRSPLRWPHSTYRDTCAGYAWSADAHGHVNLVEKLAVEYGDATSIALLGAVANTTEAGREEDKKLAQRILAKVSQEDTQAAHKQIQAWLEAEKAAK